MNLELVFLEVEAALCTLGWPFLEGLELGWLGAGVAGTGLGSAWGAHRYPCLKMEAGLFTLKVGS